MPWRVVLDRGVDPDGNVTAYFYDQESNRYNILGGSRALAGLDPSVPYIRSAMLRRIDYGRRVGTTLSPAARVSFGVQYRCQYLDSRYQDGNGDGIRDRDGSDCQGATPANASLFFDVPNDLVCTATNCPQTAPSFFTDRRYSHVATSVFDGATEKPVVQYNLTHTFG